MAERLAEMHRSLSPLHSQQVCTPSSHLTHHLSNHMDHVVGCMSGFLTCSGVRIFLHWPPQVMWPYLTFLYWSMCRCEDYQWEWTCLTWCFSRIWPFLDVTLTSMVVTSSRAMITSWPTVTGTRVTSQSTYSPFKRVFRECVCVRALLNCACFGCRRQPRLNRSPGPHPTDRSSPANTVTSMVSGHTTSHVWTGNKLPIYPPPFLIGGRVNTWDWVA